MRIGIGYDIHRFGQRPPLILGGVSLPEAPRLEGHSDGDALLHAVADAVLGAAALADIGEHFPDDDPRWEDADSALILAEALRLARDERRLQPVNVDVNVVAERPRLAPYREAIRARLAELLGLPEDAVGVKARTAEGLGPVGRGEAIEVHAAVLMERK
ncbi:MAG: 2-C-methyl-D-erythritol 2,4-cyclodiphosphate synthase [Candidatus Brocadiia bacterium]